MSKLHDQPNHLCLSSMINLITMMQRICAVKFQADLTVGSTHIVCVSQNRGFIFPEKNLIKFYPCDFAPITVSSLEWPVCSSVFVRGKWNSSSIKLAKNVPSFGGFFPFFAILQYSLPPPLSWHFALHFYLLFYVWILSAPKSLSSL